MAEGDGMDEASDRVISRTVFLSYASHDTEIANTVCQFLEARGVRCWIAPRDVAPGALYAAPPIRQPRAETYSSTMRRRMIRRLVRWSRISSGSGSNDALRRAIET